MTFKRDTSGACSRMSSGSMAGTRIPSTRNLTRVERSAASIWMSLARRCMALNKIESSSLTAGTLIFARMIERENFLAPFVLLDQHGPVLGLQFAQRLTRAFAAFQCRQNRRSLG